jgi:hypothetical protein
MTPYSLTEGSRHFGGVAVYCENHAKQIIYAKDKICLVLRQVVRIVTIVLQTVSLICAL